MIGRTNTGGGGAGLNFSVVGGTTAPSHAKENMIWLNTATKITSWALTPVKPEAPEHGTAWITIGSSGQVEFNALKKNGIAVFPLSAHQYVQGVWERIQAKVYQAGEWKNLLTDTVFYENGWFNTEVFGEISGNTNNGASELHWKNGNSASATKLFSVDGFDRIEFVFPSSSWATITITLVDEQGRTVKEYSISPEDNNYSITDSVDISGMSGLYYLNLRCRTGASYNWVRISSITFKV